jgi:casein kinase 1
MRDLVQTDQALAGLYKLGRRIGAGAFGDIYLAKNIQTGEEVAVKIESSRAKPLLINEAKRLQHLQGGLGMPTMFRCEAGDEFNFLVMDLLGPSLEDLFNLCERKFSLACLAKMSAQLISRAEFLHGRNFIHRDIKPDNFLIGRGDRSSLIYMIDFGLAKEYRDPKTSEHAPERATNALTGTARYASINAHLGFEQSRRDDLEAIGYMMVYFVRGSLPWQGIKAATREEKYNKILEKKMATPIEALCAGFGAEFEMYLSYCRALRYDERPDYTYARRLFREPFCTPRTGPGIDGRAIRGHVASWEALDSLADEADYDWSGRIYDRQNSASSSSAKQKIASRASASVRASASTATWPVRWPLPAKDALPPSLFTRLFGKICSAKTKKSESCSRDIHD